MEMEQIDLDYVELLTNQLLRVPRTGEELVHTAVEQLGQTLQYLCAISTTDATIDLVVALTTAMVDNKARLDQIHDALTTSLITRRELDALEVVKA